MKAADCKSVTQKHRRFEVYVPLRSAQDKRPLDVLRPAPSTICLRVREVYGATLLRWCAVTHRRFESFRKRFQIWQIKRYPVQRRNHGQDVLFLCADARLQDAVFLLASPIIGNADAGVHPVN